MISAALRTFSNRLRPSERGEAGRRALAIFALATYAERCDLGGPWRQAEELARRVRNVDLLVRSLERLAEDVESRERALQGVFTGALVGDLANAGAGLPALVTLAADTASDVGDSAAADFFDAGLVEIGQGSSTGAVNTSPRIAQLLMLLADVEPWTTVLDPCCGTGSILAQVVRAKPGATSVGIDLDVLSARLAMLRMYLLGGRGEIRVSDVLRADASDLGRTRFDRVVCDPPIGGKIPPDLQRQLALRHGLAKGPTRSESAFALECVDSLRAGGRAALLVPTGFLFRAPDQEVRTRLVSSGRIEGVLSLPTGIVPWTEVAFAVLLLRGDDRVGEPIAMADGSDVEVSRRPGSERIDEAQVAALIGRYADARSGPRRNAAELLAGVADLRPRSRNPNRNEDEVDLSALHHSARASELVADEARAALDALDLMRGLGEP